jgi:hypothetical protein
LWDDLSDVLFGCVTSFLFEFRDFFFYHLKSLIERVLVQGTCDSVRVMTLAELFGILEELNLVELWNHIIDHVVEEIFHWGYLIELETIFCFVWQDLDRNTAIISISELIIVSLVSRRSWVIQEEMSILNSLFYAHHEIVDDLFSTSNSLFLKFLGVSLLGNAFLS